jgi:hypothetical protein
MKLMDTLRENAQLSIINKVRGAYNYHWTLNTFTWKQRAELITLTITRELYKSKSWKFLDMLLTPFASPLIFFK